MPRLSLDNQAGHAWRGQGCQHLRQNKHCSMYLKRFLGRSLCRMTFLGDYLFHQEARYYLSSQECLRAQFCLHAFTQLETACKQFDVNFGIIAHHGFEAEFLHNALVAEPAHLLALFRIAQ